jgi:GDPmannose 4,6-dehydratase
MRKAFVTGYSGQDGYYMANFLSERGYDVFAPERKLLDITSQEFDKALIDYQPDEIYNFGGNSDNAEAFNSPEELLLANTLPVVKILNYQKKTEKETKFFQASSSLIFGTNSNEDGLQDLKTPMSPTTPYGASKLYAYNMIRTYRKHYNVFAVNGILYNHESPRRKEHFVLPKIVKGAIECKLRNRGRLTLGNLNSERDWIHAKDVVRGAYFSLQKPGPHDWIFCSGKFNSLKYVVEYVFGRLGLDWEKCVEIDRNLINKKQENNYLGNPFESNWELGWEPQYTLENILDELIEHYEKLLSS